MSAPKQIIFDNHQRPITYARLAVTDRCNLRCFYCMPEHGIQYLPKKELLTYEEMERLVRLLASLGINKIRITGGEPFVRKDLMFFLKQITGMPGIAQVSITTNGVLTQPHIPELKALGITKVNLSLDTLDRSRFFQITRRDEFEKVADTLYQLIDEQFEVKINAVVMEGKNTDDLESLAALAEKHAVHVRFIEEMPFNGEGSHYPVLLWNHHKIREKLQSLYPGLTPLPVKPHETAVTYQVPGFKGTLGIIAAYTRTFCGTCNRIRVTAQGTLKTCLYDNGVLDLKSLMRVGASDQELVQHLLRAFGNRPKDGYEAEARRAVGPVQESMSTIGG
jgi:cyclic pyranopterin phosphate synthase